MNIGELREKLELLRLQNVPDTTPCLMQGPDHSYNLVGFASLEDVAKDEAAGKYAEWNGPKYAQKGEKAVKGFVIEV